MINDDKRVDFHIQTDNEIQINSIQIKKVLGIYSISLARIPSRKFLVLMNYVI